MSRRCFGSTELPTTCPDSHIMKGLQCSTWMCAVSQWQRRSVILGDAFYLLKHRKEVGIVFAIYTLFVQADLILGEACGTRVSNPVLSFQYGSPCVCHDTYHCCLLLLPFLAHFLKWKQWSCFQLGAWMALGIMHS